MVAKRTRSSTRSSKSHQSSKKDSNKYEEGTNFVAGGIEDNGPLFALAVCGPFVTILFGYLTSESFKETGVAPHLSTMLPICYSDLSACATKVFTAGMSTVYPLNIPAMQFILGFMLVAFLLEFLPGKIETGPETGTGHIPEYRDNALLHCFTFSALFYLGSNLSLIPWFATNGYDFGIMYDVFPSAVGFLNIFGILFCLFLTYKGLHFPSTGDSGSSGSYVKDFLWGTELYPRLWGWWDLKRFVNCRFSMTFWQLAGLSFAYKSYTIHGEIDWGLTLSAVSQYLYLVKFFLWEMGYMRSIDIIVDRAGFEIQWGCLCFVPAVYTLCTRFCVQYPSGLSKEVAIALFILSLISVALNYAADREREIFRATDGKELVWGKPPEFIKAT